MTFSQASFFGLGAVLAVSAVFVWQAFPQRAINRWFAAFGLTTALWIVGIGGLHGSSHLEAWGRLTFASATLIPAAFLAFIRCYPVPSSWPGPRLTAAFLLVGGLTAALALSTSFLVHDVSLTAVGLSRKTGPLYPVFLGYFTAAWVAALVVFLRKWRPLRGTSRAHMQHLGVAILVSGTGGVACNLFLPLLTGRSTYSWLGPYFGIPLVLIVGHAIIRHRLLDLRVVIGRTLAHGLAIGAIATSAAFALDLSTWAYRDFTVEHPRLLVALVAALVMLTGPGQRILSRVVDSYLFRPRFDYDTALRQAARRFSRLMPIPDLCEDLRTRLSTAFRPESVEIYIRAETGKFETADVSDAKSLPDPLAEALVGSALLAGPSVIQLDAIANNEPLHPRLLELKSAGLEIVVLLGRRDHSLGAILLGPRRSGDAYFKTDLEFIESLAELATVALDNALLFRQRVEMLEYSQRLVESLDAAVAAADISGNITSFNPSAANLFSFKGRKEPLTIEALPSEVGWALAIALRTSSPPRDIEVHIDHPQRGIVPAVLSTSALHDDRNLTRGALVIATDLTAVKTLELNQRRLERLTSMARFYAGIAHEIRSPLTSISNFVSLLTERFDDAEYREAASRILPSEVARIAKLADRLRFMAPSEGAQMTSVDLHSLLRDLIALHATRPNERPITVTLRCPDDLPSVRADSRQLVQLFLNLLNNAIEATTGDGEISIEAVHHAGRPQGTVAVMITDSGSGIDPSITGKVFEPFFTTKIAGTGLGLAICREIADFHGATLTLRRRRDRPGTVAEVRFPSAGPLRATETLQRIEGSNELSQADRRARV